MQLCAIAMTGLCAVVIIKQWRSDFLPLIRLGVTVLLGLTLLSAVSPLILYVGELLERGNISAYAEPLLKALGVGILTHCCADICRECGESSLGAGVEAVGKVEILVHCFPLIREIVETAEALLNMGGHA